MPSIERAKGLKYKRHLKSSGKGSKENTKIHLFTV